MDKDVSAGSITSTLGHLALGLTLLLFGLGNTQVIDGVTAADSVSLATYVGGIALFVAGLFAFRDHDAFTGTAFTALGAFWFTWGVTAGTQMSANATGLFLLLFALVALSLTAGASGAPFSPEGRTRCSSSPFSCWPSGSSATAEVWGRSAAGSPSRAARSPGTGPRRPWLTGPPHCPDAPPAGGDGHRLTSARAGAWAAPAP